MRNLILIGSLIALSLSSFADRGDSMSGDKGNGGVSVVCREASKLIRSAQVLDIYEGDIRYQRKYDVTSNIGADLRVELAQLKLVQHQAFLKAFQKELAKVRAITVYIPAGNHVLPTNDAFPTIIKEGCEFEQLANYTNDGELLVSEEIFNKIDELNQAALWVHEVVYALFRTKGAKDSQQARKLTAQLLAKNADQTVIDAIIKEYFKTTSSSAGVCGLEGNVQERIQNCDAQIEAFVLVTKTNNGIEIWKDTVSGLIWSDNVERVFFQLADCKSLENVYRIAGLAWRLPSIGEYRLADKNGIRKALPNMNSKFWSSSVYTSFQVRMWVYDGENGTTHEQYLNTTDTSFRCVAR